MTDAQRGHFERVPDLPPPAPSQPHYGHHVWDDEDGDRYYLAGHVPPRRALAAANRHARTVAGFVNLYDTHGATIDGFLRVDHVWWKAASNDYPDWEEGHMVPCDPGDEGAQPFTEVVL